MLTRDQQQLLASVGTDMAADALLGRIRERGTLEGGCSTPQDGCWISYNRKAVWLEDHTEFSAALSAAGDAVPQGSSAEQAPRGKIKPKVLVKVTWAEAAAYGASMSPALRDELAALQRTERLENRSWNEFSDQRGGWPQRRRFDSDEDYKVASDEWDEAWHKHIAVLSDVRDGRKSTIERTLPLTVDAEPVDLLELLDQQPTPAGPAKITNPAADLQAGALQAAPGSPPPTAPPTDEGLFRLPSTEAGIGR
jgi:hypothetical protein